MNDALNERSSYKFVFISGNVVGSTNVESALRENAMKRCAQGSSARKRLSADQTVFYVYKGVKTFAYSESYNILVTGGMDRLVRIWNPYVNTSVSGKSDTIFLCLLSLQGPFALVFYFIIKRK